MGFCFIWFDLFGLVWIGFDLVWFGFGLVCFGLDFCLVLAWLGLVWLGFDWFSSSVNFQSWLWLVRGVRVFVFVVSKPVFLFVVVPSHAGVFRLCDAFR